MAVSRALYLSFYILYLIFLALSLWYLLQYTGVPGWVWSIFAVAIILAIVAVFIKEFLLIRTIMSSRIYTQDEYYTFWLIMYTIISVVILILIIVGIVDVIRFSNIPAGVWVVFGLAILLSIISNAILAYAPDANTLAVILSVSAFILFIVGIILIIVYANSPWWVWLLVAIAITFAILAAIFDPQNAFIVQEKCIPGSLNCPIVLNPTSVVAVTY